MQSGGHLQAELGIGVGEPAVRGPQITEVPLDAGRPAGFVGAAQAAFGPRDQVRGPPRVPFPGRA